MGNFQQERPVVADTAAATAKVDADRQVEGVEGKGGLAEIVSSSLRTQSSRGES
jgi:hypothetical protein